MQRREFIIGGMTAMFMAKYAIASADALSTPRLEIVATSPWLANGVAVSSDGNYFLNFPRLQGHIVSPALARVTKSGLVPFPDNQWNRWQPGEDGLNSLVNVNACHIFADNLLWVVDQGAPQGEQAVTGAAKLVAFDIHSGEQKQLIRFDEQALPQGGAPNDLRIYQHFIYVTDSGLGGIIIHNMQNGRTLRRLSKSALLRKPDNLNQKGFKGRVLQDKSGNRPNVHSDVIEVSADGMWLYFATPTGPLYRVSTAALKDESLDNATLESQIQKVANIPSIGGSAIDASGNIYLSDVENRSVEILRPDGKKERLIQDDRLISPDALVIEKGWIYVPAPQMEFTSNNNGGKDATKAPWMIYRFRLPA